ncbi:MAG: leucine--tRNA ligase [Flavobacteriaceae bacterium]|nr:leucine--tRNA ligase [Flavobacteriaceae bacterium]MDG2315219.1 leucine--tRNA ligase [Flavobacteriaceae bacterium]
MSYDFKKIENNWQSFWSKNQTFAAENNSKLPKYYVLDMFPYPSGAGLHVGHPLGYIASDIVARYKRHKGFNVLHPQGYDSFGLPAEQYAIQTGQHPAITTETNINRYRQQLDQLGFSFDWSREIRTSDPNYYKWTQWIFIQLFNAWYDISSNKARSIATLIELFSEQGNESIAAVSDDNTPQFTAQQWNDFSDIEQQKILLQYRLAYLSDTEVNWCAELGTVLANDEIVNGVSERGGHPVVRKKMKQWSMRISAYADRLLQGLDKIDWPEPLKEMQRNWIGKSVGASVTFHVVDHDATVEVFTTRPDTLYGVTFMTLAPEHELVAKITTHEQRDEVNAYVEQTSKRSERDRMTDVKSITGVFTGAYAIHPLTKQKTPIWIGDYVLAGYGTGAVMAVPCGDQRDYDFATHFDIPIVNIFKDVDISKEAFTDKENTIIANSDFLNGLSYEKASQKVIASLEEIGAGKGTINYRLRDAVFSRQRYWGEPFPVYYKEGMPQMIDQSYLPIVLPKVEKYLPTQEGAPPLGNSSQWAWDEQNKEVVSNNKIDHQTVFPLELNTMPGWAGSSWYFNRYMDAHNSEEFASQESLQYWKEVDLYLGGSEHATGHLLYSRFWQHFLYDMEQVPVEEYAKKLINQGMILGTSALAYRERGTQTFLSKGLIKDKPVDPVHVDVSLVNSSDELDIEQLKKWQPQFSEASFELEEGVFRVGREIEKMSKSKYNVVNPDDICEQYGADTLRMYEMFLGPIEQAKPWNTAGISGVHSFLRKLWKLFHLKGSFEISEEKPSGESLKTLHKTIKKVTEDIENFSFNTSVSSFMICVNELTSQQCNQRQVLEPLTCLISPFAPHIAEELWKLLGHRGSISKTPYPLYEEAYLVESTKEYPISFNGKMRFTKKLSLSLSPKEVESEVLADDRTQQQLNGRTPKKVIVVPGKIVNIVG